MHIKLKVVVLVTTLIFNMGSPMSDELKHDVGALTMQESLPFLIAVSKIMRIVPVSTGTLRGGFGLLPHICWLMDETVDMQELFPVTQALVNAKNVNLSWSITNIVPAYCLVGEPKQNDKPSKNGPFDPRGIPRSRLEAQQLRQLAVNDVAALALAVDETLRASEKSSLGVESTTYDLSLPGIEDFDSPSYRHFYLAADPAAFSPYRGRITSVKDRMLHFGLTESEALGITRAAKEDALFTYFVIDRLYEPYEDRYFLASEIDVLRSECQHLAETALDKTVQEGLRKILSMCDSAQRYKLGIFIDSW